MKILKTAVLLGTAAAGCAALLLVLRGKKRRRAASGGVSFGQLARALAADYDSIYYIGDDDSYTEYRAADRGQRLDVITHGDDFFADTVLNSRLVYEKDRERVLETLRKDRLTELLDDLGSVTLSYRLLIGDRPQYYEFKACRETGAAEDHIVIGVRNVDNEKNLESAEERLRSEERALQDIDPMTGAYNKETYTLLEQELGAKIADGSCEDFALVLCDVNGLSRINDISGLPAGDEYLKSCSDMIMRVFTDSSVYRFGGDEFAVLLLGDSLEKREELIRTLKEQIRLNREFGMPTLACGSAVFLRGTDRSYNAVFNRANAAMNRNKKQYSKNAVSFE